MTFKVALTLAARQDVFDAYQWYEKQQAGLGREFLRAMHAVTERLKLSPKFHARVYRSVRQTLLSNFPYVVCYYVLKDEVIVFAVFHGHRDPKEWKGRFRNR